MTDQPNPEPQPVPFEPVPDSDHLPDEVKNGEVPEDDPAVANEPPTKENQP